MVMIKEELDIYHKINIKNKYVRLNKIKYKELILFFGDNVHVI